MDGLSLCLELASTHPTPLWGLHPVPDAQPQMVSPLAGGTPTPVAQLLLCLQVGQHHGHLPPVPLGTGGTLEGGFPESVAVGGI